MCFKELLSSTYSDLSSVKLTAVNRSYLRYLVTSSLLGAGDWLLGEVVVDCVSSDFCFQAWAWCASLSSVDISAIFNWAWTWVQHQVKHLTFDHLCFLKAWLLAQSLFKNYVQSESPVHYRLCKAVGFILVFTEVTTKRVLLNHCLDCLFELVAHKKI